MYKYISVTDMSTLNFYYSRLVCGATICSFPNVYLCNAGDSESKYGSLEEDAF